MDDGQERDSRSQQPSPITRRDLLGRGLRGAGTMAAAGWIAPSLASIPVRGQANASPAPDDVEKKKIKRGGGDEVLAFTGSDWLAALLAAGAALGAGGATQYASRKRKRKRSRRPSKPPTETG